jgi:glycosyltransferase involved in cell wall biosynthesis
VNGPRSAAEPLVSVITPVYNTEKYLAECIESVLNQTYENWQYVIVDNCSSDGSLEIARSYQEKDSRIKVIACAEFVNQVRNYNRALTYVSDASKYCKIVQADDWIFPQCLTEMVRVAEANPSVGMVGAYRLCGPHVKSDGLPYPSSFVKGREIGRKQFLEGLFTFGSPTTTLLRCELVRCRTPFYEENRYHEDTEACFELMLHSDFGFVHQVLTFSRTRDDSITSGVADYHPMILDRLIILRRYGARYLSDSEYKTCWKKIEAQYYDLISRCILSVTPRGFWDYHINGLKTVGCKMSWLKIGSHMVSHLLDAVVHPVSKLERLRDRLSWAERRQVRDHMGNGGNET